MCPRPKVNIPLSTFDYIAEIKSIVALITFWVLLFVMETDTSFMVLCIISTAVYISHSWLARYPHIFNYPVTITERNAHMQYALALRLVRYLKLIVLLIFLGLGLMMNIGSGEQKIWIVPVILGLTIIPLVIYILISRWVG